MSAKHCVSNAFLLCSQLHSQPGETTKKPLTPATAFYPLTDIVFATIDGDDVKCASVVLQLDW